jgi:hypothetical protein
LATFSKEETEMIQDYRQGEELADRHADWRKATGTAGPVLQGNGCDVLGAAIKRNPSVRRAGHR